jgi:hypothetical protein
MLLEFEFFSLDVNWLLMLTCAAYWNFMKHDQLREKRQESLNKKGGR